MLANPGRDTWRKDDTCSYCGSLNPEKLLNLATESPILVGPTDKGYKLYLDKPFYAKVYMVHLNREQGQLFRRALQENRIEVGYPGYFYSGLYLPHIEACPRDKSTEGECVCWAET